MKTLTVRKGESVLSLVKRARAKLEGNDRVHFEMKYCEAPTKVGPEVVLLIKQFFKLEHKN